MTVKKNRLFVAVDLNEAALKELEKYIEKLSVKNWLVRWETPNKLHITLAFLGWIEAVKTDAIKKAIENGIQGVIPFSIHMGKLGVFPDYVQPKVIWLGIKGNQQYLVSLQRQIQKRLEVSGFDMEKRAWIPHLTIGRIKNEAKYKAKKELGRQLRKLEVNDFKETSLIDRVIIYESKLRSSGSVYSKLEELRFP